ncbi:hypothetical protein GGH94_003974 [Coemansia aciculifera]|uniref:Zn(2)-C6 fungal-type domain-containing protein n=1 Tax=Coemansia aciculifera TaxID=417176 RepID=A0A9W8IIH7_9FUNG|nr:hypothetical protein GGH94_003974 [Coemansia aciculifera]KAJ2872657.1 hypothetical protein GGH93_003847 [Coemansia aciculifera]
MDNAPITIQQQQSLQAASPTTQPSQLLRFRHSCENCRRRKIKCSGTRPICEHCLRRGIECIYKPLARSTRRSTSVASSPAMSASSATGSYGFPRQSQARARPGQPQPISIPMSGSMQYPYAMPLHLLHQQGANARYSSAPTNAESPYLQAAYQQQAQFKQPRPATAIPPHLCNVSNIGGSSMSPLRSPQLAYMYGSLPTDMGASLGSFNSMQSDATDLASPGSAVGGDPMSLVTMPSSLYDVQIPGSPAAQQQQSAMAFAGPRSGGSGAKNSGNGMSPAPSPLTSATAGFGLPTQFPVPGKQNGVGEGTPVTDSILEVGRARTFAAANHKRTMTDESSDSISNVPLIERSTFSGSYEAEGGYPNSAMSVDYNPQQQQQYQQYQQQQQQQQEHYYSLPSDFGTLIPSVENGDGSFLACNSQAYIDLISSYGLSQDPTTVAAASAANYSMLLDSKLGGWESQHQLQQPQQQQQQQQQQQPSSGLMSGIAPELTVYPPSQSQHQEPP